MSHLKHLTSGELPYLAPWQNISKQAVTHTTYLEKEPCSEEGMRWEFEPPLEFTNAFQCTVLCKQTMSRISKMLDGVQAMTVGGWFYYRRAGEQTFFCRGVPVIAPDGERIFPPTDEYVSFCLGTDQHGFFFGTIHGNGGMPFPYVTLNEVNINTWNQLVVVKDAKGYQKFYQNGKLIHADHNSVSAGYIRPFRETPEGTKEPIRLSMPMGGMIAEVRIFPGELTADEIEADYLAKKERYNPAPPEPPVLLREMDSFPAANRWTEPITAKNWSKVRQRIVEKVMKGLGTFPDEKVPLAPNIISEVDCGGYIRRKISIAVQTDDRMPAYLLIPKNIKGRVPAVICMYGTTSGAGKDTTVGLSGREPGSPPVRNYSFALDMVGAGFVVFAPDFLRDGERIQPGESPYESTSFRRKYPQWTIAGKDVWDTSRAIDYLQTLDFIAPDKIGMTGHSYGGCGTINATALEPRIKVAVANGPVSQPTTYHELTAMIAPLPLLVGQAVGEHRPEEEEIYAAVSRVYRALGRRDSVLYHWYPGDHDYPPQMRKAAVEWFRRWLVGK